ncbi:AcrR family transcriptional regulator [Saccharothrix tamanrassetensis]|uniref:AcrR family transcriptional regulator n=1 Tax=Saccharothrix tamanrassetensis TaxID=1051531 RepID=A0A841CLF8_9PSEU|nr:TetR family transcriptional regulator [Saccharothrix tamanrassetensis]MBB5956835.1 AcrR family transcriptional regulator [Saccharothrix tamanrassetensis]
MDSLRDRRRAETRRAVQSHAIRLFVEGGYGATTVEDVAKAAGVSAMTVYRHFATKEDLVLYDEYDPLTAAALLARPEHEPLVRRIGGALVDTAAGAVGAGAVGASDADKALLLARLRLMISTPALRARHLDSQYATQSAIVAALCGDPPDPDDELRVRCAAAACLGATHVALVRWAENDGRDDLPALIRTSLAHAFGTAF